MRIIAFLQDAASIKSVMKSLNIDQSRSPPKLNIKTVISEFCSPEAEYKVQDGKYPQLGIDQIDDLPDYDDFN